MLSPAMAVATPGTGSAYAYIAVDSAGARLDGGGKTYRLTLPTDISAKNFWSLDLYDAQTRSLLEISDPTPRS